MTDTIVLGLNTSHDAAACLLVNGELVTAICEERLSRVKYHEGFPHLAVRYCLDAAGLPDLNAVDCIVVNQLAECDYDTDLLVGGYTGRLITNPSHHLLHAYYAWVGSGFGEAAVLILDGSGYCFGEYSRRGRSAAELGDSVPEFSEMEEAESLYRIGAGDLTVVSKRWALWHANRPFFRFASLGHMYSMASQYIFGSFKHAGKTMGLAAYGDAGAFPDPIVDLSGPEMNLDTLWITKLPPRSALPAEQDETCRNVAAKVQDELERAILHLAEDLHRRTGETRLAVSGGVGLNSVTNGRLLRESSFTELFITPAASDAGVAIGAALYGHRELTGSVPSWDYRHDYHGRVYSPSEVDAALADRADLVSWESVDAQVAELAAADVAAGQVVGWFDLGSEFGPRSLGHRSIICDPRVPGMKDYLNSAVKFREPFRPYAASVLSEHASEYFDLDVDDPFMLIVAQVRSQYTQLVPSIVHADGTCRIQSVRPDHQGQFRALIEAFYALTGLPLVLNTSFNIRGEPIVETPADALECFLASNFDVLYLQGRRVSKVRAADTADRAGLVPALSPSLVLETELPTHRGAVGQLRQLVRTRTGHRAALDSAEFGLLAQVDRCRSVAEIASLAGVPLAEAVVAFERLQNRGLVAFQLQEARQEQPAGAGGSATDSQLS
ncbi:carbamoyltransferase family protein [Jatrophihabitans sp.]|uniref:carbamoyltransferase family protein n=1 Tax=Jatrophihabitans sp. TaxID=1932789 RepID=UPI002C870D7B|nr:carbamoyltransferase C-terminal domain-containing protein [Jatrophihabitans sp.]